MQGLASRGQPIDAVTLELDLARQEKLAAVGGIAFLSDLLSVVPTADNIAHYAEAVEDNGRARILRDDLGALLHDQRIGSDELAARAAKLLDAFDGGRTTTGPRLVRISKVVDEILGEAALPVISTGFMGIDTQLGGGLRARMIHLIIAGSGKGKTSLAIQIAARHAETSPVLYYSGELTRAQLAARLIGQRTDQSWRDVLRGHVSREDMLAVLRPLEFDILRGPDPVKVIATAADEMLARGRGVPLVVIDYAQLVADIGKDPRLNLMLAIRQIAALVETRSIVLLLLAQGSRVSARAMRNGAGGGANTEDFIDAGAETSDLEKFASTVIVLSYQTADGFATHEVTAMIAKQRLGGPCKAGLKFHGPSGRWEDLGHAPASVAARKERERTEQIVELVGRHPRHWTKTELKKSAGGDSGPTLKLINKLLEDGDLVLVNVIRTREDGQRRPYEVVDLPAKGSPS